MNDLTTLCNLPSHVWWLYFTARVCLTLPGYMSDIMLCFYLCILQVPLISFTTQHSVSGKKRYCSYSWEKLNSFWCLHAAISQAPVHGGALFIQNSNEQHLRSTCMRVLAADCSSVSIQREAIINLQLANSLNDVSTLIYTETVIIGLWYSVHSWSSFESKCGSCSWHVNFLPGRWTEEGKEGAGCTLHAAVSWENLCSSSFSRQHMLCLHSWVDPSFQQIISL